MNTKNVEALSMTPPSELKAHIATRFRSLPVAGTPQARLRALIHSEAPLLTSDDVNELYRELSSQLFGFGAIQQLLDDPSVDDVLINGENNVWVDRGGNLQRMDVYIPTEDLYRYIERLVTPLGLQADRSHPIIDARLDAGTRVSIVLPPVALDGPVIAFRRHRSEAIPLSNFCPCNTAGDLMGRLKVGQNMVVYGATGSGKTTVAQGLLASLEQTRRIVLVEDTAEIQLPHHHVVRLEARPGTTEGNGRVAMRDLVRTALRLRPDHLVVGEVRGPEALDLLWALTTGHRGSVSTCHAQSGPGAVKRLAYLAARDPQAGPMSVVMEQAFDAVDVVVGVQRRHDGQRVIHRIEEVHTDASGSYHFDVVFESARLEEAIEEVDCNGNEHDTWSTNVDL